jgi:hypothetical protein
MAFFWGLLTGAVLTFIGIGVFAPDAFALIILNYMPV